MEGSFIEENAVLSRVDMDRILRSYRKMGDILSTSRSFFHAGQTELDETAVLAEMYSLRAMILAVEDPRERMFLYHYYIKGQTLEMCAKIIGTSMRSVCRIKNRALDNLINNHKKP